MKDEEIRSAAARLLIEQMGRNARLLDRCETLAGPAAEVDSVAALNAAARLTRAAAAVAAQLARFAHVESRNRSTVDVNKATKESQAELNRKKYWQNEVDRRKALEKVSRLMDEVTEEAVRARMGDPAARDRIKHQLDECAELKKQHEAADFYDEDEQQGPEDGDDARAEGEESFNTSCEQAGRRTADG